tara:strand:+ start:251 stop:1423 length:1173 start_codon:yes stop_codon:yes gene_type:complete
MNLYQVLSLVCLSVLLSCNSNENSQKNSENVFKKTLWEKGSGKYNNYRIPSLVVTKKGTVLAFAEGREAGDTGDIDILLKRSLDNGKTWSDEIVVWDQKDNSCGNPVPVVDEQTGRIWLFTSWNDGRDNELKIVTKKSISPRIPYVCYSDDDGLTWSDPVNMSKTLRDPSWGWYATGPGVGIQIKKGKYKGRLLIPANHSYDDKNGNIRNGNFNYGAHVLFSDDNGSTWERSEDIRPGCNESQIVELENGNLMMNMRSYNDKYSRAISISNNGGESWSKIYHDLALVESKVQGSILNFGDINGKNAHIFSNPSVPLGRLNMTLKVSFDDCKYWSISKLIYGGLSAYSCLTRLPDGNIGLFFEKGTEKNYEQMIFVSIPVNKIFSNYEFNL